MDYNFLFGTPDFTNYANSIVSGAWSEPMAQQILSNPAPFEQMASYGSYYNPSALPQLAANLPSDWIAPAMAQWQMNVPDVLTVYPPGAPSGGAPSGGGLPPPPITSVAPGQGVIVTPPSGPDLGMFGQPMGAGPGINPLGSFGVGGEGGSFFGGGLPYAPGAAGGLASPGALAYGLGPFSLPGATAGLGGGGGPSTLGSYGTMSPYWMTHPMPQDLYGQYKAFAQPLTDYLNNIKYPVTDALGFVTGYQNQPVDMSYQSYLNSFLAGGFQPMGMAPTTTATGGVGASGGGGGGGTPAKSVA